MTRDELKAVLDNVPVIAQLPDSKAVEELQELLDHPGLKWLWSLMLGAKQGQLEVLRHAPLTNMETVSRASVIQGTINGIELFYETLLEQSVPSQSEQQEQKQ